MNILIIYYIKCLKSIKKEGMLLIIEKSDDITNDEGYKIKIEKDVITIVAKQPNGAFYGLITLRDI